MLSTPGSLTHVDVEKDGKRFRIRSHVKKLAAYARAGVGHAWLVDPSLETLEVFRRQGEDRLLIPAAGRDDVLRATASR